MQRQHYSAGCIKANDWMLLSLKMPGKNLQPASATSMSGKYITEGLNSVGQVVLFLLKNTMQS